MTKRYGLVTALDRLTLRVEPGEIVGLVGHNGAGKTTLVEIISGLVRPDSGTVLITGHPPKQARGLVGIAPQNLALYPSITVHEHLELYGRLAGLRRRALSAAIDDLALGLGLTEILDRSTGVLSGGQQRRTQAAAALLNRPPVLVLDEPTAGADLSTRQAMLDLIKQRAGEGAAVLYTTHYLPELTDLDASIAVIRQGSVVARGNYDELVGGLPGEVVLHYEDGSARRVTTHDPASELITMLSASERPVTGVDVNHATLDDLYQALAVGHVA
ncbi:ABC transporter ATP-binding protein [Nocardioides sp. GXZ039]|uniref:ABC transporter ATP-binding protein n=1 Tax=Nocardioides sp. GXZ039 TaxID=3136018 RepID=UPI0030F3AE4B